MKTSTETLAFDVAGTGETIELTDFTAVVAGYTGRDAAAVQHHIDELAAIGVAPPPAVPMFYPVESVSVSPASALDVAGEKTSGEIEPLYIRHRGRYYLGIASDHTDRHVETIDIGDSKRACPKPVAGTVVAIPELESLSLDECRARSWVDGRLYQGGTLDGLRTPANVVELLLERSDIGDGDFVCLGGTLPVIGGEFVYGREWRIELTFPDGNTIDHTYIITKGQQS
jgi:4-hydroxyphenylacetate 3-monooxygenase